GRPETTIGDEKAHNELFRQPDRVALVARLAGSSAPPANMAAILRHNLGDTDAATIDARDLASLLEQDAKPFVLDVRTALEFDGEHIEGARNVPLEELETRVHEIPSDPVRVVVCRTGVRATLAAEVLARDGRRAQVLEGGMNAWRRNRLPVRLGRR